MAYWPYAIAAIREDCSLPLSGVRGDRVVRNGSKSEKKPPTSMKAPRDTDSIRSGVVHRLRGERRPRVRLLEEGLLVVVNHSLGDIYYYFNTSLYFRIRNQSIGVHAFTFMHPQPRDFEAVSHMRRMYATQALKDRS